MYGLIKYLARAPQHHGFDRKEWVKVNKIIKDTGMTRKEIYMMATKLKPKGLINWTFSGLFSIESLSRLAISNAGIEWLRVTERINEDAVAINPEFLMKDHQQH